MRIFLRQSARQSFIFTSINIALFVLLASCFNPAFSKENFPIPAFSRFSPARYDAVMTSSPVSVDGLLDDNCWKLAAWSDEFVDITGDPDKRPYLNTRMKIAWDDHYLYIGAELEEPHLWGTLTDHDAVIFHDNDFELFIDPDGDTYNYYELEINTLNTTWDLLLTAPYRDHGHAVDSWEIPGLLHAVKLDGTLNNPTDRDRKWTVELAYPWKVLEECANRDAPPEPGDTWRINFSRVQWELEIVDGGYRKKTDPVTGEPLPEQNWVWSPQGLVNMHYPEMWGMLHFISSPEDRNAGVAVDPVALEAGWTLRNIYYAQRIRRAAGLEYTDNEDSLTDFLTVPGWERFHPVLLKTHDGYQAYSIPGKGDTQRDSFLIDQTGRLVQGKE